MVLGCFAPTADVFPNVGEAWTVSPVLMGTERPRWQLHPSPQLPSERPLWVRRVQSKTVQGMLKMGEKWGPSFPAPIGPFGPCRFRVQQPPLQLLGQARKPVSDSGGGGGGRGQATPPPWLHPCCPPDYRTIRQVELSCWKPPHLACRSREGEPMGTPHKAPCPGLLLCLAIGCWRGGAGGVFIPCRGFPGSSRSQLL